MVKKIFTDGEADLSVCFTDENKFIISVEDTDKDSLHFCSVELDADDIKDLINDLQYYLNQIKK